MGRVSPYTPMALSSKELGNMVKEAEKDVLCTLTGTTTLEIGKTII